MTNFKKIRLPILALIASSIWLYYSLYHHPQEKEYHQLLTDDFWEESQHLNKNHNNWLKEVIDGRIKEYPRSRENGPKAVRLQEWREEIVVLVDSINQKLNNACDYTTETKDFEQLSKRRCVNHFVSNNVKLIDTLHHKLRATRQEMIALFDKKEQQLWSDRLPQIEANQERFDNLSVAEFRLLLHEYIYTVQHWEGRLLIHLFNKVETIAQSEKTKIQYTIHQFQERNVIALGETYTANIFPIGYVANMDSAMAIMLNNKALEIKNGLAKYQLPTAKKGTHNLAVAIGIKNPWTGEMKTYKKDFKYLVK